MGRDVRRVLFKTGTELVERLDEEKETYSKEVVCLSGHNAHLNEELPCVLSTSKVDLMPFIQGCNLVE